MVCSLSLYIYIYICTISPVDKNISKKIFVNFPLN